MMLHSVFSTLNGVGDYLSLRKCPAILKLAETEQVKTQLYYNDLFAVVHFTSIASDYQHY